jgi:hypothetical protein
MRIMLAMPRWFSIFMAIVMGGIAMLAIVDGGHQVYAVLAAAMSLLWVLHAGADRPYQR